MSVDEAAFEWSVTEVAVTLMFMFEGLVAGAV